MMIEEDQIHVWFAYSEQIQDPHLLSQYHRLLNEKERLQQKRFHFEKDRHQYLVTRAMVRTVLSLYAPTIAPEDWKFQKNRYGKPSIGNRLRNCPLQLNISHTEKLVVMAVTLEREIGVDVEYLLRAGKTVEIADRFFSPNEINDLLNLPREAQKSRFFDLWTLKEAYIKACGMGLSIPLNHFSYTIDPDGIIGIAFGPQRDDQPDRWKFWQIQPTHTHKVAMALKCDRSDRSISISMRNIIPLAEISIVTYPIATGRILDRQT